MLFTAAVVGGLAKWLIPGLPWAAAIALGAIVAPPDAVAATSVLKEFRIPKRIVTVLEGESLLNDASSLVLYRFAVTATAAGAFSFAGGSLSFFVSAFGGSAIGLAVGWLAVALISRMKHRLLEIVATFLAGFGSYFAAEAFHVSGVLAAVACGGPVGRQLLLLAACTRLDASAAWEFIEFVLTALVFLLIGLELRGIISRLEGYDVTRLTLLAVAVSAALIVSRIAWVFGTLYPVEGLQRALKEGSFSPPLSYPAIISWAGMRGVVSLAAALALPDRFPERDMIVFLAFCAIFATLVLQGTTLGALIRRLGIEEPEIGEVRPETVAACKAAALDAVSRTSAGSAHEDVAEDLVAEFKKRVEHAGMTDEAAETATERQEAELDSRLAAITAARDKLVERRGELDGETLATLVKELDLEEERIRVALGRE